MGISLKIGTFTPSKLLNTFLASYSLRKFDFLLLHNEYLDKSIFFFPFLVFKTFGFLLSVFFLHFKHQGNIYIHI